MIGLSARHLHGIGRGWSLAWVVSAMVMGSLLPNLLGSDVPSELVPSVGILLLWVVPLWLAGRLRNSYSRTLIWIWVVWFGIGSCNLVASYLAYGDFYLVRADPAALVYEAGITIVVAALLLTESLLGQRERRDTSPSSAETRSSPERDVPSLYLAFLLAFPFAYVLSMLASVGHLPILQGRSFVEEIYETDYGPLYGYGTVLVFSMLGMLQRARSSQRVAIRVSWILLGLLFLFIAVADGKRFYAVIVLLSIYPLYSLPAAFSHRSRAVVGKTMLALGTGGLVYLGVLIIRSGHQLALPSILPYALAAVGVEYRDFAYSVNHFVAGSVPGYDWLGSTVYSLLNSQLLAVAGIDKAAETLKGSAYVWRDLFGSAFGIRTGIISELYFAYGLWGAPVLLLVGILIGVVTQQLAKSVQKPTRTFWAVLYAIAVLMIVGQSTSTAGLVSLVFYTYCVYWVCGRLTLRVQSAPALQREVG